MWYPLFFGFKKKKPTKKWWFLKHTHFWYLSEIPIPPKQKEEKRYLFVLKLKKYVLKPPKQNKTIHAHGDGV